MKHKITSTFLLVLVIVLASFTSQQKKIMSMDKGTKSTLIKIENMKMDLSSNASIGGNKKND